MMDFGFAAFLEKFEDHFGRAATKILLILIGLAIVAATGSIILSTLIRPLLTLIPVSWPSAWEKIANLLWNALLLGGGIAVGFMIITGLHHARAGLRLESGIRQAKEVLAETEALRDQVQETVRQAEDVVAAGDLTVDQILVAALEKNMITQDQFKTLQSLRKSELKIQR